MKRGFSLLELLVVVALITLLATIAIPNLNNAILRAKIARSVNDMKALSVAIESYFVEYKVYPATDNSQSGNGANKNLPNTNAPYRNLPTFRNTGGTTNPVASLTTPVAYIGVYPSDPFAPNGSATFSYSVPDESSLGASIAERGWIMWSVGPGGGGNVDNGSGYSGPMGLVNVGVPGLTRVAAEFYNPRREVPSDTLEAIRYDPTNGLRSPGVVFRVKQ